VTIRLHPHFKKSYKKRIANNRKLVEKTRKRLELFKTNPHDPILGDHQLKGERRDSRGFSITGDIRIVYKIINDEVWLYDIGTHNQVY